MDGKETAVECENPFISVLSYRKKNVCMIEIRNSIAEKRFLDGESGLPLTTCRLLFVCGRPKSKRKEVR